MENRKAVKEVVSFAKKCFKQTKPKSLEARRVKDEKVTDFGFPPVVLRSKARVKYIVCADYSDQLRVYFFSNSGQSLGAKNYDKTLNIKKEIAKKSNLITKFPRKRSPYAL
jgi:hypothetical protein